MKPRTIEEVHNLRKYNEMTIGGMLYKVMEDFDKENKRVLVCCYKDYPDGDFDEKNTYYIGERCIMEGLSIKQNMKNMGYFVKKFQEYDETTQKFPVPYDEDKLDELYQCYCHPYKHIESFVERAAKAFPDISEEKIRIVAV